jgi:hypothetical protein
MQNGYKNFANDTRLAFRKSLTSGNLSIIDEFWFKDEFCYRIILESKLVYCVLSMDAGDLIIFLVDKKTKQAASLDDLFFALFPSLKLKEEKKAELINPIAEELRSQNASNEIVAKKIMEHYLLDELIACNSILEKYFSDILHNPEFNWLEQLKIKGFKTTESNIEGL